MAKVAIVDDSEIIREQLRTVLEANNHVVVEGFDGNHGLEVVLANRDIDFLITDLNMPGRNGVAMCQAIRQDPAFANMDIIMLTTEQHPDLKEAGRKVGVKMWIVKPIKPKVVASVLEKLIKVREVSRSLRARAAEAGLGA